MHLQSNRYLLCGTTATAAIFFPHHFVEFDFLRRKEMVRHANENRLSVHWHVDFIERTKRNALYIPKFDDNVVVDCCCVCVCVCKGARQIATHNRNFLLSIAFGLCVCVSVVRRRIFDIVGCWRAHSLRLSTQMSFIFSPFLSCSVSFAIIEHIQK